jgi:hypothetical protein
MNQILDYANRIRTIEEVAQLLKASLGIRMLKGRSPLEHKYAFVRHSNPNAALNVLCVRLSHATVRINNTKYRLGEVKREPLYIRLYDDKSTLV